MSPLRCMAVVLLLAAVPLAAASHTTYSHGGEYVAGTGGAARWCSSAPHDFMPPSDPFVWPWPPWWWVNAMKPECQLADAANAVAEATGEERAEYGFGGFAWKVTPDLLAHRVTVSTQDALGGAGYIVAYGAVDPSQPGPADDISAEGCGAQSIVLPPNLELHWESAPQTPAHLFWAFLPVVGIEDDLDLCFHSTGWVTATWS